jgi:hypothetical protein
MLSSHIPTSKKRKRMKWYEDENALLVKLGGDGTHWEDVSKRFPGRSPVGCRNHYSFLEKQGNRGGGEKDTKLAKAYDR